MGLWEILNLIQDFTVDNTSEYESVLKGSADAGSHLKLFTIWTFFHCPCLKERNHDISETGYVSIFRREVRTQRRRLALSDGPNSVGTFPLT